MLRLCPDTPPLWRTPTELQFGTEAVATLRDPAPWQLRIVRDLEAGVAEPMIEAVAAAAGAPDGGMAQLLAVMAPALDAAPAPRPAVAVRGEAGLSAAVGEALGAAGWSVAPDAAAVILVAHGGLDPRDAAALMAHDVAHAPLVFLGGIAEVGPAVTPGTSACLACLAAHRRDVDDSWPALASQLIGRWTAPIDPGLLTEAALAAAKLLSEALAHPRRRERASLTLHRDRLHRRQRSHRPHPQCRCRSLAGTATAADPGSPEPTRAAATAVPA